MEIKNLNKDEHYLLACSFGVDSMCLMDLLLKGGYSFSIAFVNYHLRKESGEEEKNIKLYAKNHNLDLYIFDNKEIIKNNIEATCRKIRYDFFLSLYHKYHFSSLLVAHHLDDLIETYYLQKERSVLLNYYGIKEISYYKDLKIIRPLLNYTKEEILKYNIDNNVPYSIDKTNLLPIYKRNKIRIEKINKMNKEQKLKIKEEIDSINLSINNLINGLKLDKINKIYYLLSLDKTSFLYALNILIKEVDPSLSISKSFAFEIEKIMKSNKPNIKLHIKGELYLEKSYDELYFYIEQNIDYIYTLLDYSLLDTPYFYFNVKKINNRNIKEDDFPICIRPMKKNDEYIINNYKVKINKLFSDFKMPLKLRKYWPVILNKNNEIIYIPRYKNNYEIKKDEDFYVKINM